MSYQIIEGDIFETQAKYLAHQCNAITTKAAHLSASVFARYPWADIYSPRAGVDFDKLPLEGEKPGDIVIKGNGQDQRYVINMIGQLYPGKPKFPESEKDGYVARQFYFRNALLKIIKIPNLESVAFPYKVGCGAAGGEWDVYDGFLKIIANKIEADVFVYKLPGL